jgi:hypothetical protein
MSVSIDSGMTRLAALGAASGARVRLPVICRADERLIARTAPDGESPVILCDAVRNTRAGGRSLRAKSISTRSVWTAPGSSRDPRHRRRRKQSR